MKEATKQLDETKLERKELQEDAIKTRDDTHRMAEANKAFAHFKF